MIDVLDQANLKDKEHLEKLILQWSNMSDIDGSGLEKGVLEMLSPNKGLEELKIPSYPTLNFQIGLVTIFFVT